MVSFHLNSPQKEQDVNYIPTYVFEASMVQSLVCNNIKPYN